MQLDEAPGKPVYSLASRPPAGSFSPSLELLDDLLVQKAVDAISKMSSFAAFNLSTKCTLQNPTIQQSHTSRCLAKGTETSTLKRYLHTHVCCDICHRNNLNVL